MVAMTVPQGDACGMFHGQGEVGLARGRSRRLAADVPCIPPVRPWQA